MTTDNPGKKSNVTITATSLGNQSRNSSVRAEVDFAIEVRGYKVEVNIPERMVVNKTYDGSFQIMLDVKKIMVAVSTPSQLMVMPLAQVVDVSPRSPGTANFSMLASESGRYPVVFRLVDSNGIPMPEEITYVDVGVPEGLAVLSGEDLLTAAPSHQPALWAMGALPMQSSPLHRESSDRRTWRPSCTTHR